MAIIITNVLSLLLLFLFTSESFTFSVLTLNVENGSREQFHFLTEKNKFNITCELSDRLIFHWKFCALFL